MYNIKLFNWLTSGDTRTVLWKKNIFGGICIKGISILISLILIPLTLSYVTSEIYGIWLVISSITMWLSFFDIGFTSGLKNKLAEAIALNKWEKAKSLVSSTYFIMGLIFIPISILLVIIIPYFDWCSLLNVNKEYTEEIIKSLQVVTFAFCVQMIVNTITSIINAYQKTALAALIPVIGNLLSLCIICILIYTVKSSLVVLSITISFSPIIVAAIFSIILFKKQLKNISPQIRYIDKNLIKEIFGLGAKFFIIQIQVIVLYQMTNFLITRVSSPEDVTAYNIAYKYLSAGMMIFTITLYPLWSAFTDAYTKKDFYWMRSIYKKVSIIFIISCVVLIVMLFVSPFVYQVWIGSKAIIPLNITLLVCVYMIFLNWNSMHLNMINGIGAIKMQMYLTLIGALSFIPLALTLGEKFEVNGILMAMISINAVYAIVYTVQLRKILTQKAFGIWIQ